MINPFFWWIFYYLFGIDLERYNNDVKLANYVSELDNKDNLPIIFINKVLKYRSGK